MSEISEPEVPSTTTTIPTKKNKLYIICAIIAVLLISGLGYWYWTTTPQYSLNKTATAITNHDLPSFNKYVDVDSVVSRMIDQLLESESTNKGNAIAVGAIKALKPKLVEMFKSQILTAVEKGKIEETDSGSSNISLTKYYPNTADGKKSSIKGVDYVKKEGNIALVGLKLYNPRLDQDLVAEVKMRDMGSYWQVAEVSNFSDLTKKIEELEKAKLAQLNKPIIDKINSAVTLKHVALKRVSEDSWGFSYAIYFEIPLTFLSEKSVTELSALLEISNLDKKVLLNMPIQSQGSTHQGQESILSWKKDINPFIAEDKELYQTPDAKLNIEARITGLKFADGAELKLLEELP